MFSKNIYRPSTKLWESNAFTGVCLSTEGVGHLWCQVPCSFSGVGYPRQGVGYQWDRVRVPTRTGKPGKMGRHFPVREKSGNFEQTGKVRENHTKYWKTEGISGKKLFVIFQ